MGGKQPLRKTVPALLMAIALALPALAGPADNAYSQAQQLRAKGDFEGAIKAASGGLAIQPDHFALNLLMGDLYFALNKYDSSLVFYRKAAEKKSKDPDALYGAGMSAFKMKSYDEALQFFKQGEKTGKGKGKFLYGEGLVQMEQGDYRNADLNFRKALDKDKKNPLYHLALGEVNYRVKTYPIAISEFTQAMQLDSTIVKQSRDIHYKLAQSYLNLRNLPKAIEEYKLDLGLFPADTSGWMELARIYDIAGNTAEAIYCYTKYLELAANNGNAWYDLGKLYLKLPDAEKAAAAFEKAVSLGSHVAEAYGYLANIYSDRKEYEKAIDAYNRYEAAFGAPDSALYWMDKGRVEMMLGEKNAVYLDSAVIAFNKAAGKDSTLTEAYELAGLTMYFKKDYADAIPYFKKRIALDSTSVGSYRNLAFCYLKTEQYAPATAAFEKALALKPDDVTTRAILAKVYSFSQNYQKAVDQYEYILGHNPEGLSDSMKCEIYPDLGLSYLSLRKCQQALPNLLKAERCKPNELSIIKNIALSYQLCNRTKDAHDYYKKCLTYAPNDKDCKKGLLETTIQGEE